MAITTNPVLSVYVDGTSGSNSNGGTSDADAYATIQYALDNTTLSTAGETRFNIKSGYTHTLTAALDFTTIGENNLNRYIVFRGYDSVADDGGVGVIDGDGTYSIISDNNNYRGFLDMEFRNSGSASLFNCGSSSRNYFHDCYFHNCSAAAGLHFDNETSFYNCRFENLTGANAVDIDGDAVFLHCFFDCTNSASVINNPSISRMQIERCIIRQNSTTGGVYAVPSSGSSKIVHNSIIGPGGASATSSCKALDYGSVYNDHCYGNIIEGFYHAIQRDSDRIPHYIGRNHFYDIASTAFNTDYGDEGYPTESNDDNASSGFARSGSVTYANRMTYFAPQDVGNVFGGGFDGLDLGAIQREAGGGGGSTVIVIED